jgi:hypothetical protein
MHSLFAMVICQLTAITTGTSIAQSTSATPTRDLLDGLSQSRSVSEQEIRELESRRFQFRKSHPNLTMDSVIAAELQALSRALVEAQLVTIDAKAKYAATHPTLLAAIKKEQELFRRFEASLKRFSEVNDAALEHAKLETELEIKRQFLKRLDERIRELEVVAAARPTTIRRVVDPATDRINAGVSVALGRTIPEINLDGVPLTDAIDFIRNSGKVNVVIDWQALQGAGVERATTVSLRLRDVSSDRALTEILALAGSGRARYYIDEGIVRITTADDAERVTFTRTYDVRDLAADARSSVELRELVERTISPATWINDKGGQISTFGGKLVVTASDETHREVGRLLDSLRAGPATAPAR